MASAPSDSPFGRHGGCCFRKAAGFPGNPPPLWPFRTRPRPRGRRGVPPRAGELSLDPAELVEKGTPGGERYGAQCRPLTFPGTSFLTNGLRPSTRKGRPLPAPALPEEPGLSPGRMRPSQPSCGRIASGPLRGSALLCEPNGLFAATPGRSSSAKGIRFSTERDSLHVGEGLLPRPDRRGNAFGPAAGAAPRLLGSTSRPTARSSWATSASAGSSKNGKSPSSNGPGKLVLALPGVGARGKKKARRRDVSNLRRASILYGARPADGPPFEGYDSITSLTYQIRERSRPSAPRAGALRPFQPAISKRVILRCPREAAPSSGRRNLKALFDELDCVRSSLRNARSEAPPSLEEEDGGLRKSTIRRSWPRAAWARCSGGGPGSPSTARWRSR